MIYLIQIHLNTKNQNDEEIYISYIYNYYL